MPEPRMKLLLIATYLAMLDKCAVIIALNETTGSQFPTYPGPVET